MPFLITQVPWHRGDHDESQVTGVVARLNLSPDVVGQRDGESLYLARLPEGPIVVVDSIGELIWDELSGRTLLSAVERIASQLNVAPEQIARAVESFVNELVELGFVLEVGGR